MPPARNNIVIRAQCAAEFGTKKMVAEQSINGSSHGQYSFRAALSGNRGPE
jgi:hypothetical protein